MVNAFAQGRSLFLSRLSRRRALKTFGLSTVLLSLGGCSVTLGTPNALSADSSQVQGKEPAPGRKTVLEFYSVFGNSDAVGWVKLAERFEQAQSTIGIRITYAPSSGSNGSDNPKLLTAIAGNNAPDIAHVVPFATPQWADLGVMTDLSPYMKAANLTSDDFWSAAWHDMTYQGKTWQLQCNADPNFPFFWNKNLFAEAGLDPERPPQTIDEVDEYSARINKSTGGHISRIGIIPWDNYGASNSLFTWGWSFGGEFYDEQKEEVTPDNEYVVKALEWFVRSAQKVGGPDKVSISPPNLQLHPFSTGNLGMSPMVAANTRDVVKAMPDMKIGAGLLPYQAPGAQAPGAGGWIGGWSVFIPQGARNPDAAWEFIKWFSATPEGTSAFWQSIGALPGYRKAPILDEVQKDPIMGAFYQTLITAKHSRPSIPISSFYTDQLDLKVGEAIYGKNSPLQALKEARENTMKEWERYKRERGL
jgi:multiple sugar transport system substrate-binding protein